MSESSRNQIKNQNPQETLEIEQTDEEELVIFNEERRNEYQSEDEIDDSTLSLDKINHRRKFAQLNLDSDSDIDSDENDSLLNLELDEEDIAYLNNISSKSPFRFFGENNVDLGQQ
jgi:hypothetical protein